MTGAEVRGWVFMQPSAFRFHFCRWTFAWYALDWGIKMIEVVGVFLSVLESCYLSRCSTIKCL